MCQSSRRAEIIAKLVSWCLDAPVSGLLHRLCFFLAWKSLHGCPYFSRPSSTVRPIFCFVPTLQVQNLSIKWTLKSPKLAWATLFTETRQSDPAIQALKHCLLEPTSDFSAAPEDHFQKIFFTKLGELVIYSNGLKFSTSLWICDLEGLRLKTRIFYSLEK